MAINLKYIAAILLGIGLILSLGIAVKANPSFFLVQNNGITSTATTSVAYMTAGTATTTYYMDTGAGTAGSTDGAVFRTLLVGSSTASSINIAIEYANGGGDCITTPTSCEWFSDTLNGATTTLSRNISTLNTYLLNYASTTVGGAAGTGNGRNTRIFRVETPVRYLRAVITMPIGSLNGAVWGEFIGKRQVAN